MPHIFPQTPLPLILLVGDFLHPCDRATVDRFGNGDMRHRILRRRAVPVFHPFRYPDDIALMHLLNRLALALDPAFALRHYQRLTQRMRMPRGACARLKGHRRTANASGCVGAKHGYRHAAL